jgi:hypothetical protein
MAYGSAARICRFWNHRLLQPEYNYYLYRDAKSGKFYLIPWGADAWSLSAGVRGKDGPRSVWADGHLSRRLWELPEMRERYRKEMRRLLAEVWDEPSILSELQRVSQFCQDDLPNPRRVRSTESIARFIGSHRAAVQAELDRPAADWTFPRTEWGVARKKPNGPPMLVEGSFTAVVARAIPTNMADRFDQGAATLQFTVAGETRKPFARAGAMMVKGEEFTTLAIVAEDAAGKLHWRLPFFLDEHRSPPKPGTMELGRWSVTVLMFQDDLVSRNTQRRERDYNTGTLELTQVTTNLGGTISGKFKINTTAFEEEKKP